MTHQARPTTWGVSESDLRHLARADVLETTGSSGSPSRVIFLFCALITSLIAWSWVVDVTTSASAPGTVVPTGRVRMIQHLEGGLVSEIAATDGDIVGAGDLLIRFEPTLRTAELNQVRAREGALRIRLARLRAFIDDSEPDFARFETDYPELVAESRFALTGARDRLAGQIAVLTSRIDQQQKSIDVFDRQIANLTGQRALVQEAVDMREELFENGHGSRVAVIDAQLQLAQLQGAVTSAEVNREQTLSAIEEIRNQILELQVTERGRALDELESVTGQLAEVRETRQRFEDRVGRLEVRAPAAGTVHGSRVNTVGAVVEPAEVLMSIVPVDAVPIVESRIDPADVGHIRVGQPARISISGFDVRRYGTIDGRLAAISPTTFSDPEGRPYFRGEVELEQDYVEVAGVANQISPGMTVDVSIVTGKQTLFEYLTGPVYAALVTAFSER